MEGSSTEPRDEREHWETVVRAADRLAASLHIREIVPTVVSSEDYNKMIRYSCSLAPKERRKAKIRSTALSGANINFLVDVHEPKLIYRIDQGRLKIAVLLSDHPFTTREIRDRIMQNQTGNHVGRQWTIRVPTRANHPVLG